MNSIYIIILAVFLIVAILIAIAEGIYIGIVTKKNKVLKTRSILEDKIDFFRKFWSPFVIYVIATSIISLFVSSFIIKENIQLGIINEWVSIILGMIAMIIGIISLYLSFYNVDQAQESLNETRKLLDQTSKEITESLRKMEERLGNKIESVYKTSSNWSTRQNNSEYSKAIEIKEEKKGEE